MPRLEPRQKNCASDLFFIFTNKVPTSNFMLSPAIFAQDFSCFQKLKAHFPLLLLTSTPRACTTGLRTNLRQRQRSPYFLKYRCLAALPLEVDAEPIFLQNLKNSGPNLLRKEAPVSLSVNSLTAALAE